MKLFERNEKDDVKKQLTNLQKSIIASNELSKDAYTILINYIEKVKENNNYNDFLEIDFLIKVFIKLTDRSFNSEELMKNHLGKIISCVHELLPLGIETPNYKFVKEMIINNFVGNEGILDYDLFDLEFYSLFDNKNVYLNCMNIITSDYDLISNYSTIYKYACRVSRYCLSKEIFYADIISFLSGMKEVVDGDYVSYANSCLETAKKRIGVYSIDEKAIALCNSNLEKIEGYLEQMKVYEESLEGSKTSLKEMLSKEKAEIKKMRDASIRIFRKEIQTEKEELLKKLDDYLLDLESTLKDKSDTIFKDILENYKKQIRDMRLLFQGYSRATSEDFVKIQKAAEESVQKLQTYVQNDEQLKDILAKANENNEVRDKLIQLVEKEQTILTEHPSIIQQERVSSVITPGIEKEIIPVSPQVIIPANVDNTKILNAFDESIDFSLRMEKIQALKELNERKGKIYHQKTLEIVKCLMEGDWPYLTGPSGCGKSYLMQQVAELLGIELVKNGKITEPYTVIGYTDPQGRFRATQTYIALVYGKLLAYDEFDNGNPDTQVVINEIYSKLLDKLDNINEKQFVTFAEDVPAEVHPNFRLISGGNTTGGGENMLFSSRGKIDESVQERMTPIYVGYDNRVEEIIFDKYKAWYSFFIKFREACDYYAKNNNLESAPGIGTTRDASAIVKYLKHNSKTLDELLEQKFIQTKEKDYLVSLARYIAKAYNIPIDSVENMDTDKIALDSFREGDIAKKFIYKCNDICGRER